MSTGEDDSTTLGGAAVRDVPTPPFQPSNQVEQLFPIETNNLARLAGIPPKLMNGWLFHQEDMSSGERHVLHRAVAPGQYAEARVIVDFYQLPSIDAVTRPFERVVISVMRKPYSGSYEPADNSANVGEPQDKFDVMSFEYVPEPAKVQPDPDIGMADLQEAAKVESRYRLGRVGFKRIPAPAQDPDLREVGEAGCLWYEVDWDDQPTVSGQSVTLQPEPSDSGMQDQQSVALAMSVDPATRQPSGGGRLVFTGLNEAGQPVGKSIDTEVIPMLVDLNAAGNNLIR